MPCDGIEKNVVFCITELFVKPAAISIYSLVSNNPGYTVNLFKVGSFCTENLKLLCEKYGCQFREFEIEIENDLKGSARWPVVVYARLFIPRYIKSGRALYMDSDTIIDGSLDELFELDMGEYELGAVGTVDTHKYSKVLKKRFELSNYFNAGVLLMDCDKLSVSKKLDKALELAKLNNKGELLYQDQDALNLAFGNEWLNLDEKYNHLGLSNKPAVVYHFAFAKPWKVRQTKMGLLYQEYLRSYPFKLPQFYGDVPMNENSLYPLLAELFWRLPIIKQFDRLLWSRILKLRADRQQCSFVWKIKTPN
ncbi:glycosyltransferase family 8 protein [Pseudoalteromonas umbrosa]|uniref:glycosyltransferase family 8 protein n=1 Tax=Pseudoalteromonas umbrosa TaxID=3048489 RepID=UPI0024C2160D|nr:glycosyltransferase family 8 protein [Pseudoalteromonas sp. B95]MDK1288859.1 glycosyltransferase family 8 protein [Pseudoalteromonas sp. B95]